MAWGLNGGANFFSVTREKKLRKCPAIIDIRTLARVTDLGIL
jgi:hypothetical protein